ncbi:hypothetical protein CBR_g45821 [Chara braunii]|uniref:Reverse transcriptase domain-containing protein n=1 Tax=Chara braunii TaxID=69332 RepID=A0A388LZC2_CHABU|nr:hypothetical protein CBR_g45821 [Chara braunii]|eukprot:GBG87667.1 hypothetical protein CBR_g45821 [Chara braunii]
MTAVGKWRNEGKLGKAYIIPKDKDLQRWRPIAPACDDPARLGQRRCARALHCLITRYDKRLNFHLASTIQLKEEALRADTEFGEQGCSLAIGRCYDIKEMFSSIPHDAVRSAVFELIRDFENKNWCQVKVAVRGRLIVLSKTDRKEVGYVKVGMNTIFKMVNYDLSHAYMRCGETIRRQIVGIPMGKTMSPILATVTCAMDETKFLKSLGADKRLVKGWRMVDDVSIVVGCNKEGGAWTRAHDNLDAFEAAYDPRLKLVRKDDGSNTWQFVGGRMYIMADPVQVHFVQDIKNADCIRQDGMLRYQSLQDFVSYSEKKMKKAVMTANLKRIWNSSTSPALTASTIAYALLESDLRGYPSEVSLGALAKLAKVTGESILVNLRLYWLSCHKILRRLDPWNFLRNSYGLTSWDTEQRLGIFTGCNFSK